MTSPQTKTAIPYRPRRAALNWVDYLVIAATALVFIGVLAVNKPHAARAQSRVDRHPGLRTSRRRTPRSADRAGLIKARIGLALAGR